MQMDDMILVSIDDHMVEPPDMYDNHVPDKYRDLVPKVVRNDAGVDEWHFQGQATSTPFGMAATVGLEPRRVGLQPRLVLGAAAGLLRRARARPRHGRQRRARVDELPDHGRLQRPHLHGGRRQGGRARRAARLQRLGDRRVVRQLPGSVHPAGDHPDVGRRPGGRGDPPARQEGLPVDQLPRDAARAGLPELPVRPLGSDDDGALRRGHGAVAAHRCRLRGDPPSTGGADRPPHGAGLPDQRHHRAGPALRADAAPVPRPQGGAVGGRDRLDPLLLRPHRPSRPEPDLAARRRRLRRQAAVGGVPRPHPRLLHHRPVGPAPARPHRHRHHRLGVRLPPHRHHLARVARARVGRAAGRGLHRRGDPQDHLGERLPVLRLGPLQAHQA